MSIITFTRRPEGYPSFTVDMGSVATPIIAIGTAALLATGIGFAFASTTDVAPTVCDNLSPITGVATC